MDFIAKYNALAPKQFGFTTNSSTELAITTIYDKLLDNSDKNQCTCAVFRYISKKLFIPLTINFCWGSWTTMVFEEKFGI